MMTYPAAVVAGDVTEVVNFEVLESRLLLSATARDVVPEHGQVLVERGGGPLTSHDVTADSVATINKKKKKKKKKAKKKKKKQPSGGASVTLSGGVLRVNGTPGSDQIGVSHSADVKTWQVLINGRSWLFTKSKVSKIIVQAQAGDDKITVASPVGAEIYAGEGDDSITGPVYGTTLLDGGAGDDLLLGLGQGNTFVGGAGKDTFIGHKDDTVLDAEDGELVSLV